MAEGDSATSTASREQLTAALEQAAESPAAAPRVVMPPTPFARTPGTRFVPARELTEEQQSVLRQFRENLADLDLVDVAFCTDDCLVRYLRARDFNLRKSEALLRDTLAWRKRVDFENLDIDTLAEEFSSGKLYPHGFDKLGRPVQYQRPRRQNTKHHVNQVMQVAYVLEREAACMDVTKGIEQHVLVVDFKGYSIWNAPPMSVSRQVMDILLCHYPERLGHAFMIEPPGLFHAAYRILRPFIPPATREKIRFVKRSGTAGRNGKMDPTLAEFFDDDDLEEEYGGTLPSTWDFDAYWAAEKEHWKTVLEQWRATLAATRDRLEGAATQDDDAGKINGKPTETGGNTTPRSVSDSAGNEATNQADQSAEPHGSLLYSFDL